MKRVNKKASFKLISVVSLLAAIPMAALLTWQSIYADNADDNPTTKFVFEYEKDGTWQEFSAQNFGLNSRTISFDLPKSAIHDG